MLDLFSNLSYYVCLTLRLLFAFFWRLHLAGNLLPKLQSWSLNLRINIVRFILFLNRSIIFNLIVFPAQNRLLLLIVDLRPMRMKLHLFVLFLTSALILRLLIDFVDMHLADLVETFEKWLARVQPAVWSAHSEHRLIDHDVSRILAAHQVLLLWRPNALTGRGNAQFIRIDSDNFPLHRLPGVPLLDGQPITLSNNLIGTFNSAWLLIVLGVVNLHLARVARGAPQNYILDNTFLLPFCLMLSFNILSIPKILLSLTVQIFGLGLIFLIHYNNYIFGWLI